MNPFLDGIDDKVNLFLDGERVGSIDEVQCEEFTSANIPMTHLDPLYAVRATCRMIGKSEAVTSWFEYYLRVRANKQRRKKWASKWKHSLLNGRCT